MKTVFAELFCVTFPVWIGAMGDEPRDSHHHYEVSVPTEQLYQGRGKVKSFGEEGKSVRIFHEPIPELKWPAMNMKFEVADPEMIRPLETGENVRFEFVIKDGSYVITKISR